MTDFNILPANGKAVDGVFVYPIRIYYEDTDAGGIVYYANYLKFAERARTEFLRELEIHQQQDLIEKRTGFIVRSCHIEYLKSAVLDDALIVTCQVTEIGAASAVIAQEIKRGNETLATLEVKVIYMNISTHRPTRIPTEMIEKFKLFNHQ
ncbi:MAG: tol-pal system-associated acyl-CoA thioesterase [Alphaproteobacteria bacterium]|nr:tol-pal system-associated acyl-CoA thioesterase [Alphaproteobacteria bacterium]